MAQKRKSIVIDEETKDVFDWSMKEELNRNSSKHIRKLLEKYHGKKWSNLLIDTRICKEHGKPYTLMCKDCKIGLCPECKIYLHKGHDLQFYCRIHQVGYQTTCVLCECDRWNKIVDIDMISADRLEKELGSENTICVDVRGESEWDEGHFPKSHHIKGVYFRLQNTDEHKGIDKLIEENRDKHWIFISQGYIKDPKLTKYGRGWLAAADLKTVHQIENVSCLEGGWVCFHLKFPDIVEGHKSNGSCQICKSRRS
ncbi:MAG: rhodanese-like domain-containing protein [ANME-2 cluster archaeon]|nr:rhodanese-like domain-containing protein [ANME-2 cluster archaeon]